MPRTWLLGTSGRDHLSLSLSLVFLLIHTSSAYNSSPLRSRSKSCFLNDLATVATIYVSSIGNDANDGSISAPVQSLIRAATLAAVGEDVQLAAGTYTLPQQVFQTGGKAVVFKGGSPGNPSATVLQCSTSSCSSSIYAFVIVGADSGYDLTFQDVSFVSTLSWAVAGLQNSVVRFRNCVFPFGSVLAINAISSTIDALNTQFLSRVLLQNALPGSSFSGCTFSNQDPLTSGAALSPYHDSCSARFYLSTATISNTVFRDNVASSVGGAMCVFGSSVTVSGSSFLRNAITGAGPAFGGGSILVASVSTTSPYFSCTNCVFSGNIGVNGGAARFDDGTFVLTNSVFTDNTSPTSGGAIFGFGPDSGIISGCTFEKNAAFSNGAANGGAIALLSPVPGSSLTISNSLFDSNQCSTSNASFVPGGGAILLDNIANVQVSGTTFKRNVVATGLGGAFYASTDDVGSLALTFQDSTFDSNIASGGAGNYLGSGIASSMSMGTVSYNNCTFVNNSAASATATSEGGGISIKGNYDVSITNSRFSKNIAYTNIVRGRGSSISAIPTVPSFTLGRPLVVDSCEFSQNGDFDTVGSSILTGNCDLKVSNSAFTDNRLCSQGAGIYSSANDGVVVSVDISNSRFVGNKAYDLGAAITLAGTTTVASSFACDRCWFEANTAGLPGSGVTYGATLSVMGVWNGTISRSTFKDNRAFSDAPSSNSANGGALHINTPRLQSRPVKRWTILDSHFEGNSAGTSIASGGAIFANSTELILQNTVFRTNKASNLGGAIFAIFSQVVADNITVSGCSAVCGGGGIRMDAGGEAITTNLVVRNSVLESNFVYHDPSTDLQSCISTAGGAIHVIDLSSTIVDNCVLTNNTVTWAGPNPAGLQSAGGAFCALRILSSTSMGVVFSSSVFHNNRALGSDGSAGAIYLLGTDFAMTGSNITSNYATATGGGLLFVSDIRTFLQGSITGSRFEDNSGCEGAGAHLELRDLTSITIDRNSFIRNFAKLNPAEPGQCRVGYGVGLNIQGNSTSMPNITRCSFDGNYIHDVGPHRAPGDALRAVGFGLRFYVDDDTPTSPISVSGSTFVNNFAITSDAAWAAVSFIGTNISVIVDDNTFCNNSIRNWDNADLGGLAGALFAGGNGGYARGLRLQVSNSLFENNTAAAGGSMFVRNSYTVVTNTSWIRNSGYDFAGAAFFVTNDGNYTDIWTTTIRGGSKFIGNRAGYATDGCCYASLMIQGNHMLSVDTSTQFLENEFNSRVGLATDLGCIAGANCSIAPVTSNGESIDISGVLLADDAVLDVRRVTARMRTLKIWDSAFKVRPSYVFVGNYNLTSENVTLLNYAILQCGYGTGTGQVNLYGATEIVGEKTTKTLYRCALNNYGVVKHYESRLRLIDSVVRNNVDAKWAMENFSPTVNISSANIATVRSSFVNSGTLSMATGMFSNFTLDLTHPTSRFRYMVSNYWSPSTIYVDSTAKWLLGGTFTMDGNPLRQYTEPRPFQVFDVLSSTLASNLVGQFSQQRSEGGYHYRMWDEPSGGGVTIKLIVVGFYPTRVQINPQATYISVVFPRATNFAASATDCATILHSSTLSLLNRPQCLWKSSSELIIRSNSLPEGQNLVFIDAVITDQNDPTFYVWGNHSSVIMPPDSLPTPTVVVVGSRSLLPCTDIKLDASASYGTGAFSLSFDWTLVSINGAQPSSIAAGSELASFISSQNGAVLTVPASQLAVGWTQFRIDVTASASAIGTSSIASINIARDGNALVEVFIEGPESRVIPTAVDTQINARINVPQCQALDPRARVTSKWTIVSGPQVATLGSVLKGLNTTTLYIPARSFAPEAVYVFQYTATVFADASSSTPVGTFSDTVRVTAVGSPMSLVSVGDAGTLPISQAITVSVRLDDPDEASLASSNDPPQYAFVVLSCPSRGQLNTKTSSDAEIAYSLQQASAVTFAEGVNTSRTLYELVSRQSGSVCSHPDASTYVLPFPMQSSGPEATTFQIPGSFLAEGEHLILALAARGSRTTNALISISATTAPVCSRVRIEAVLRGADKHLSHNRLLLRGFVDGVNSAPAQKTLKWSIVGDVLNTSSITTSIDNINLVLAPSTLQPGRAYTFQLDVIDSSQVVCGSNVLTVVVNSSPRGGNFSVSPPLGGWQGGLYNASITGWIDDDPPMRYVIFTTDAQGSEVILSDVIDLPSASIVIPIAGEESNGFMVPISARVIDAFESATVVSQQVQVFPVQSTPAAVVPLASLLDKLHFATVSGDLRSTLDIIGQISGSYSLSSDASLRCELAMAVDVFGRSIQFTPATMQSLLRALSEITSYSSTLSTCELDITLRTLEASVSGSTSAARLAASQNSAARTTAIEVLKTVSNLVKQLSKLPQVDEPTRIRLVQLLLDLAAAQAAFSVMDEVPILLSGNDLLMLTATLSPSALKKSNITLGDITIILNLLDPSKPVDINLIRWINSTFPIIPIDGQVIGGTVITANSTGDGTITVIFAGDDAQGPADGLIGQTPKACGVYDSTTHRFDSSVCRLVSNSDGSFACTCDRSGSFALIFNLGVEPPGAGVVPSNIVIYIAAGVTGGVILVAIIVGSVIAIRKFISNRRAKSSLKKRAVEMQAISPDDGASPPASPEYTPVSALSPPASPVTESPWSRMARPQTTNIWSEPPPPQWQPAQRQDGQYTNFNQFN